MVLVHVRQYTSRFFPTLLSSLRALPIRQHCVYQTSIRSASGVANGAGPALMADRKAVVLLKGKPDAYDGIILDENELPSTSQEFETQLQSSLKAWRDNKSYRGVWLKLPIEKSQFIAPAVEAGFVFHHAEPGYAMLTHWLPEEENRLPANASHQVGVGAFVMNEHREVLVVQERTGPLRGTGVWKMPTGLVQAGEDVTDAAERETLEETGIVARFDAVLAIRQAHGFGVGRWSDLFMLVALKPDPGQTEVVAQESDPVITTSIPREELKEHLRILSGCVSCLADGFCSIMQEAELVGAKWMPLDEFQSNPFSATRPLYSKLIDCCVAYANGTYPGLAGKRLPSGREGRTDLLMYQDALDPE